MARPLRFACRTLSAPVRVAADRLKRGYRLWRLPAAFSCRPDTLQADLDALRGGAA